MRDGSKGDFEVGWDERGATLRARGCCGNWRSFGMENILGGEGNNSGTAGSTPGAGNWELEEPGWELGVICEHPEQVLEQHRLHSWSIRKRFGN